MLKFSRRIIVFGILMILTFGMISINSQSITVRNDQFEMELTITDAYYDALDADDIADDVIILFNIYLFNNKTSIKFELNFTLTLPSGRFVHYSYNISSDASVIDGTMYFFNEATEAGFYNIKIDLTLLSGVVTSGVVSHDFDPPGETAGGIPPPEINLNELY